MAQKDYYPHLPDVPPEVDDEEETVKIVQLVKSDEPLVRNINNYLKVNDEIKKKSFRNSS